MTIFWKGILNLPKKSPAGDARGRGFAASQLGSLGGRKLGAAVQQRTSKATRSKPKPKGSKWLYGIYMGPEAMIW